MIIEILYLYTGSSPVMLLAKDFCFFHLFCSMFRIVVRVNMLDFLRLKEGFFVVGAMLLMSDSILLLVCINIVTLMMSPLFFSPLIDPSKSRLVFCMDKAIFHNSNEQVVDDTINTVTFKFKLT
jgi:hypothetical protein